VILLFLHFFKLLFFKIRLTIKIIFCFILLPCCPNIFNLYQYISFNAFPFGFDCISLLIFIKFNLIIFVEFNLLIKFEEVSSLHAFDIILFNFGQIFSFFLGKTKHFYFFVDLGLELLF